MDGLPSNKKDFIKNRLLPAAVDYFSDTLKVESIPMPLKLSGEKCRDASIPSSLVDTGVNADLILFVTAQPVEQEQVLAWAAACFVAQSNSR